MEALNVAIQALRDTGEYWLSAGLACQLLHVIPDSLIGIKPFSQFGDNLSSIIHQAGLEIDERFKKDKGSTRRCKPRLSKKGLLDLRLEKDQKNDPRWEAVLGSYSQ